MRCLMLAAAAALCCCGPPAGPTKPTPTPKARAARPRPQPEARARARRPPPRRPPRPKRWVALVLGRVQAAPRTAKGSGQITAVVAAGSSLVTAARDRAGKRSWLRGWDAKRRKLLWTLRAPARRVSLSLSADGRSMLVTTPAGTNHVYRLGTGKPVAYRKWKRKRGQNRGRTQGLSADGSMLIRGDVRGQVRGYSLEKYKMKWLVKGERVLMSGDGKWAAVIRGKVLQVYVAVTGRKIGPELEAAQEWITVAIRSTKMGVAWIARSVGKCALWGGNFKPRMMACLRGPQLSWSPGAKLLGITGVGVARVVGALDGRVVTEHKSRSKAPLRLAFFSDTTFVLANETPGQLTFYRLVKR